MTDTGGEAQLLEGLRVLDCASYLAAPCAAAVLGDFGADVIKIEPPRGDPVRGLHGTAGLPESEVHYAWLLLSRNKRSLMLDLNDPKDHETLCALVETADVFITNYPPRVVEKLRLAYEDLSRLNDRLIYAWLTGYGETGPECGKPGFDGQAYWARSGLMDLIRETGSAPMGAVPGFGDQPTGIALTAAILMALYRRERTGKGGRVGASLHACGLWANAFLAQAALAGAEIPKRPRREDRGSALAGLYKARCGRWFSVTMLHEEDEWPRFVRLIERPELERDPRFADKPSRRTNARELIAILDDIFATRDWAEWSLRFREARIPHGAVERLPDLLGDEQAKANEVLWPIDPDLGAPYTINSPFWVHGARKAFRLPPPQVGEHSAEIRAEISARRRAKAEAAKPR
ncbi:MAG: CoA transferase [Alphaproteobacteria bacterium]|nr:CoA transferase [Alphaproteobacteria bacterium]